VRAHAAAHLVGHAQKGAGGLLYDAGLAVSTARHAAEAQRKLPDPPSAIARLPRCGPSRSLKKCTELGSPCGAGESTRQHQGFSRHISPESHQTILGPDAPEHKQGAVSLQRLLNAASISARCLPDHDSANDSIAADDDSGATRPLVQATDSRHPTDSVGRWVWLRKAWISALSVIEPSELMARTPRLRPPRAVEVVERGAARCRATPTSQKSSSTTCPQLGQRHAARVHRCAGTKAAREFHGRPAQWHRGGD